MGSPKTKKGRNADEGLQHKVKVDDFWMGTYEITWDQYEVFMHDMLGYVAEWTADEYKEDYFEELGDGEINNPYFKPTVLYPCSVGGSSWVDEASDLRSAARQGSVSLWKEQDPQVPKSIWWLMDAPFIGFRLVWPKIQPSKEEMEKYWIEKMMEP